MRIEFVVALALFAAAPETGGDAERPKPRDAPAEQDARRGQLPRPLGLPDLTAPPECFTYHLRPTAEPERTAVFCAPGSWHYPTFCWRTYEPCPPGSVAVGCMVVNPGPGSVKGTEFQECRTGWMDCHANHIDNPSCCEGVAYGRGASDCP